MTARHAAIPHSAAAQAVDCASKKEREKIAWRANWFVCTEQMIISPVETWRPKCITEHLQE
jgi:hypothetical protein